MALDTRWLRKAEDKEERKSQIVAAAPALKVLKNILEDSLAQVDKSLMQEKHYECPNWQYLHSDYIAQKRILSDIITLLTMEEK